MPLCQKSSSAAVILPSLFSSKVRFCLNSYPVQAYTGRASAGLVRGQPMPRAGLGKAAAQAAALAALSTFPSPFKSYRIASSCVVLRMSSSPFPLSS